MNKQTSHILFAAILSAFMLHATALRSSTAAQKSAGAPAAALEAVGALPVSDGVLLLNTQPLLQTALPRVLLPEDIDEINSLSDFYRAHIGVDPRQLKSVAIGFRSQKGIISRALPDYYATLKGAFDRQQITIALRAAAPHSLREEEYNGRHIYVFDLDEIFGVPGAGRGLPWLISGFSLAVLDDSTLALGNLINVRRTIDASDGQGRINAQLVRLATLTPDALISVAALGNKVRDPALTPINQQTADEVTRALEAIDQFSAALTMRREVFELLLFVRTSNARQTQTLKDVLLPLIQQLGGAIRDERLRAILNALEVSTEDNVLHARTEIPQALVATLIKESQAPPPSPHIAPQVKRRPKTKVRRRR